MGSPRPPPPPPPPGPPPPALPSPPAAAQGGRLRALHWEPVPAARVRGRRSVWAPRAAPPPLDLPRLRLLFREPRGAAPGQRPPPAAALLEPKRSLALGVFLKQVKRPVCQIVRDIQEGVGAPYGAEKLLELLRMLPGAAEVARLRSFPGSPRQLADPELFMLLLTEVPSYAQRLELLVLKEDFFPRLSALRSSIQTLTDAAVELLECEELHTILHLILSAGNHLNSGGYAGSAAGFRLASLLKLPDTKANEPGMDLLHFVAMLRFCLRRADAAASSSSCPRHWFVPPRLGLDTPDTAAVAPPKHRVPSRTFLSFLGVWLRVLVQVTPAVTCQHIWPGTRGHGDAGTRAPGWPPAPPGRRGVTSAVPPSSGSAAQAALPGPWGRPAVRRGLLAAPLVCRRRPGWRRACWTSPASCGTWARRHGSRWWRWRWSCGGWRGGWRGPAAWARRGWGRSCSPSCARPRRSCAGPGTRWSRCTAPRPPPSTSSARTRRPVACRSCAPSCTASRAGSLPLRRRTGCGSRRSAGGSSWSGSG
ncbi:uncharacterized protein LJ206_003447 isoform 3-T3 [Theristicus caerulescens]